MAADFDGDGKMDIASRTSYGQWWVGRSTGTRLVTTVWAEWDPNAVYVDARTGDFAT
jgi:hypothetical protein